MIRQTCKFLSGIDSWNSRQEDDEQLKPEE